MSLRCIFLHLLEGRSVAEGVARHHLQFFVTNAGSLLDEFTSEEGIYLVSGDRIPYLVGVRDWVV